MGDNEVDFEIVNAVNQSWDTIKKIPNHVNIAGELLFRKIFELAPPTLSMFSFGPQFVGNEEALYKSEKFVAHARGVVVMLDAAVNMLGPDLEPVTKALADLGALHVNYGVLPAHYGVVGESLLCTLETALGDHWTPNVQKGWTMIFGYIATAMMAGANHALEKQLRRKNRIAARARKKIIISPETKPSNLAPTKSSQPEKRNTSEVLLDLTGVKPQEPTKKLRELTDLIDDVLVIETDSAELNDDLSLSSDETDPADSKKVNYSRMVANVYTTWNKVKRIPNYTEVAGVLLFRNIFELAPVTKDLFPFAENYGHDTETLLKDPIFITHANSVVIMLDLAVNMLGPDLEPVTEALEDLGARHCQYGVVPAHYPVVGEALLKTLQAALGNDWTPTVKEGWTGIYGFICISMQRGASTFIEEEMDAAHGM